MTQFSGRFCRLFRPMGALLLLLAIMLFLVRERGVTAPAVVSPTAGVTPQDTQVPTAGAQTLAAGATATLAVAATPTPAAQATPTVASGVAPTPTSVVSPTVAATATASAPAVTATPSPTTAVALPVVSVPTGAELTAEGVRLRGTGQPGARVELWDGASRLETAVVGADGQWALLGRLEPGTHRLVVRTLDAAGAAVGESPAVVVSVPGGEATPGADVTADGQAYIVQRNDWLTMLARRFYGDPSRYTWIVAGTNAKAAVDRTFARIINLNRVYVGQKLWIPSSAPTD